MNTEHANIPIILFLVLSFGLIGLCHKLRTKLYLRKIEGVEHMDYAIARAAEQGKSIIFTTGITGMGSVLYACLILLKNVVKKAAQLRTSVIVPQCTPEAVALIESTMIDAYANVGLPEDFSSSQIRFLSEEQFAFASGYSGIVHRENIGTAFLFGQFAGESLILSEAGKQVSAYQIAGSVSPEQVPFFICTCDYTLIGEELFAASAYVSNSQRAIESLRVQDILRIVFMSIIIIGSICTTFSKMN